MGIGKSRTPSINVDDMLEKAEINHEIEAEKQDADKRLAEVREAKDALVKIHQDLQDAIKAEHDAAMILKAATLPGSIPTALIFRYWQKSSCVQTWI